MKNDRLTEKKSANTIDLLDISKCILGIEEEKTTFNDFETMKTEQLSDEFVSIEAIKKYLNEAPVEFADFNTLDHLNEHCYNSY